MIKEKTIKIFINSRNKKYYLKKYGDNINKSLIVDIEDVNKNSKAIITAICDICGSEKKLSIQKYYKNYNNYNIYTCKKCSKIKNIKTNQNKYGVNYPLQNLEIKNKLKNTLKNKYGVDNIFKLESIKEKIKNTNKKKYGFEFPLQNKNILKKQEETNIKKYGVKRPSQNNDIKIKISNKIFKLFNKYNFNFLNKINNNNNNIFFISCEKCGEIFSINEKTFYSRLRYSVNLCTKCNPLSSKISNKEKELFLFIKNNYNGKIITSDRKILDGKEIDIYLPELKLAFEFNGNYWHSEKYKNPGYHFNKSKMALKKEIRLYHIWENEWDKNNDKIKKIILEKLNEKYY